MNQEISKLLELNNIKLFKIERSMDKLINDHPTYKNNKDIVGRDILYGDIQEDSKIFNTSDKKYFSFLDKFYTDLLLTK